MVLATRFYGIEISCDIGLPSSSQNFTSYLFDVDVNFCMDLSYCLILLSFQLNYSQETKPFTNQASANASMFDFENFQNRTLKDAIKALANKGWAAEC